MDAPFPMVDVAQPVEAVAKLLSKSNPGGARARERRRCRASSRGRDMLQLPDGAMSRTTTRESTSCARSRRASTIATRTSSDANHGTDGRHVLRARRVAGVGAADRRGAALARARGTCVDTARGPLTRGDEQRAARRRRGEDDAADADAAARAARESLADAAATLPRVRDADVVFLGAARRAGRGRHVQALLDLAGVPYTGSGHLASALAMDKDLSKHLFRAAGVPTADWLMAREPATPSGTR